MGSIDGEIPAVRFLISSIGFVILTFIQFRNTGKRFNTIFLSIMAIIFLISYLRKGSAIISNCQPGISKDKVLKCFDKLSMT